MRPGSPLLRDLHDTAHVLAGLPVFCYWTPWDLMVPARSSQLDFATGRRVFAPLHGLMPSSALVSRQIVAELKLIESGTAVASS